MIFRPYCHFETGCAGYVFGCGTLGTCAAVDIREEDIESAATFAASKNMRITHIIDTHVHADHRSGGMALARRVDAAYCLHESAIVAVPFEPLKDGHESICLVVTDFRRGTDPWFVLTGDTLFIGAVGRPDLRGRARESAADRDVFIERLADVPPEPADEQQMLAFNRGYAVEAVR